MRRPIVRAMIAACLLASPALAVELSQPPGLEIASAEEPVEEQASGSGNAEFAPQSEVAAVAWAEEIPAKEASGEPLAEELWSDDDSLLCGDVVGMEGLSAPPAGGQWSVLTELTALFPSYSTATLATANEHPILGPRVSVGWESDRGFGIRGRGWGFEGDSKIEQSPRPSTQGLLPYYDYYYGYDYNYYYTPQAQVVSHQINFSGSRFDLDFYKRLKHSTGDFAFGASVTAAHLTMREQYTVMSTQRTYGSLADDFNYFLADFDDIVPLYREYRQATLQNIHSANYSYNSQNRMLTTTYQGGQLVRNRGAGLGLLAEGSHRLYETPYHIWSVFGRGRIAYLIGRWDEPYSNTLTEGDGNMAIGEAALGLEYRRSLRYADLSIQCAFEVQSWDVSIAERINLAGVTTGAALSW